MALISTALSKTSLIFSALVLLAMACSSGSTPTTDIPTPVVLSLRALPASSDLAPGENRFVFALLDSRSSPIRASRAQVALSYVEEGRAVPYGEVEALFRRWPEGPGGVFTTKIDFSRPGTWLAEITPTDGEAAGSMARLSFLVKEQSATPAIGAPAPRSNNRTAADVASLEELTSDAHPDPELYQMTVAQALQTGQPLLVTFATPAFCASATCGPQVDVVKALKETYRGRINVIHVEVYENPHEIMGDLSNARLSPEIEEWGLPTEPWTFIVDGQGRVAAKFEAFSSYEEIDEELARILES
jgi:hypothetical protein